MTSKAKTTIGLCVLAAGLAATPALAHNYTFIEGGYVDPGADYPVARDDGGLHLAGSGEIADNVNLFGEFVDTGVNEQASFGAQYHAPLSAKVDFTAGGSIESFDGARSEDTGFGARAGLRWMLSDNRFELNPEIRHIDVGDATETSVRLASLFRVAQRLDLRGAVQRGDDDRLELGARYNF